MEDGKGKTRINSGHQGSAEDPTHADFSGPEVEAYVYCSFTCVYVCVCEIYTAIFYGLLHLSIF